MTLQEFKAWFDGFTENMGDAPPTKLQWARIQARVKEIDGAAITYPVFVDRYWPPYPNPYQPPLRWTASNIGSGIGAAPITNAGFNATAAMTSLGQADYAAIQ